VIKEHIEIHRPSPPATNHMSQSATPAERPRSTKLETDGVIIEVLAGDAIIITCLGNVTVSTRVGQATGASLPLGQTQIVVRRDPPASSRATEVGLQPR
jgi:hypothetical protein